MMLCLDRIEIVSDNVASMLKDPLITPLFSIVNMFAGQALLVFIIPALWYTNTWQSGYVSL